MDKDAVKKAFEAYHAKYKKTEGDESAWSAVYTDYAGADTFEINFTKCPRGDVFKFFENNKKLDEVVGWDAFFDKSAELAEDKDSYDPERFFQGVREMV